MSKNHDFDDFLKGQKGGKNGDNPHCDNPHCLGSIAGIIFTWFLKLMVLDLFFTLPYGFP